MWTLYREPAGQRRDARACRATPRESARSETPRGGIESRFRRVNGERFDVRVYEAPLVDAGGRQLDRLQQTSRLITMGEMAHSGWAA